MTVTNVPSSLTLDVESVCSDDRVRVESAFERFECGLYRYLVVRAGGDTHLADDLMQQLWLQATRHARNVPENELEFWLRGVAKNLIRAHWRKQSRQPTQVPLSNPNLAAELSEQLVSHELPVTMLEQQEIRDQLMLALTNLRGEEQELIIAHYFRGLSYAELASKTGISERAIEGRLYRARHALRASLMNLET